MIFSNGYDEVITDCDEHVWLYRWMKPQIDQHRACDKVWQSYEKGKMTLDQAIEASYRTGEKMQAAYARMGYTV